MSHTHTEYYNSSKAELYYDIASDGNQSFIESFEYQEIRKLLATGTKICEFGCGEGSKVGAFSRVPGVSIHGIDISEVAIERANKHFPGASFFVGDIADTSFEDEQFDISITCFVLEHVIDPCAVIDEMIRTTKKDGYIILWFPNYGSPLFPSPPTLHGKTTVGKAITILTRLSRFILAKTPIYTHVEPILDEEFQPDYDTISEIYMGKLIPYLEQKGLHMHLSSSRWENIDSSSNPIFRLYFLFRMLSASMCRNMGPQCFIILKK